MRKLLLLAAVVLLSAIAQPARAQFCPGAAPWVFDDVPVADPFCGYITWAAQNGITLGCAVIDANHRLYCPGDPVRRDQMAAFVNRLGNVRVEAVDTGPGLTGGPITSVGKIGLDTTQLLPTTACTNNQIARWNGSAWACSSDANSGGTVTSVASGTGLSGGPITTSGSLSIAAGYQLPQACANGQVAKSNGAGSWTCASDANSGGTVTSVATGVGLAGGPITVSGTINLAATQLLPAVACASGQEARWNGAAWACANPNSFAGNIDLPTSTSASVGNLTKPGGSFLHNYGIDNTFAGVGAGNFTMTGTDNAALGYLALSANTSGSFNTAHGGAALNDNTSGSRNTASGGYALSSNITGSNNSANGYQALFSNTIGIENTASGSFALHNNSTGGDNTALGVDAIYGNTTGIGNTAVGAEALANNTTGSLNLALGYNAGAGLTTGSNNVDIANSGLPGEGNTTRIGTPGTQTRAFVAGIRGVTTGINDALNVVVDSTGQLGTINSSRKAKDDIADMGESSGVLMKLHPVTFRYKSHHGEGPVQYGLIAEEVAEVAPELAAVGSNGEAETVYYQHLAPMLLNEYQKQQRIIEAQARDIVAAREEIAEMKRAIEVLLARTSPEGRIASH